MIKYSLFCENDHVFEGWFSTSTDYDEQLARDLVTCPLCNSLKIQKSLMAPSVTTSRNKIPKVIPKTPTSTANKQIAINSDVPEKFAEVMTQMRALRDHVKANSEDVGTKFSEEARKIHYGEAGKRGIYGQASHEEVKELVDEGVVVVPLPELPEDKN